MFCKIIIFTVLQFRSGFGNRELTDWTALYDYKDYGSSSLFFHNVPELATESTWGYQVDKYPEDCEDKNVTVVIQHGSFPVINPLGEKFPENFYVERSPASRAVFSVISNNVTLESTVTNPKQGPWYSVAFLPPPDSDIKPSDLFTKCKYKIRNWFSAKTLASVDTVNVQEKTEIVLPENGKRIYKFYVPLQAHDLLVKLNDCKYGNQSGCAVTLNSRGQGLPGPKPSTVSQICSETDPDCVLELFHPEVNAWNYLEIQSAVDETWTASLLFVLKECTVQEKYLPDSTCQLSPLLSRFSYNVKFRHKFAFINGSGMKDISLTLAENQSRGIPFSLRDGQDTGGSLVVKLKLKQITTVDPNDLNVKVDICLHRDVVPVNVDILHCENGYQGNVSSRAPEGQGSHKVVVPYPQAGIWVLAMMMQCFKPPKNNNSDIVFMPCGAVTAELNVTIATDACVEGECSNHGRCINYLNGQVLCTTCRCNSGWRGYDCSDGSEVKDESEQLIELLLLTISNIVFIPAIILALYRKHYAEALVYTYTMVFSTLYHACDGGRMEGYKYCILHISILSTCDFLGSATSIWMTLVAMSRPPLQWKALIQIAGPLGLLIGVLYKKTSAFLFLVPAGLGLLLIMISWMCRCCYRHKCYPSKKKYLICFLPGALLVCGALAIFTFLQNEENYLYTHSAWHVCMALSIVFLLPPRETRGFYKVKKNGQAALASTYQPIRSNSDNYAI
ncbi:post-GPI attachment to proteins factor 6-like [Mercenaria mercenaria]|uniref:post-GPI attachment to proteins factor 6-like n=1 Tax=Mercenaria mercenaria TaxID=6596 RepID=UPI00234F982A|nr:post-GPI attachment to proteins factor 6-like [Mercenaria mercenaria]